MKPNKSHLKALREECVRKRIEFLTQFKQDIKEELGRHQLAYVHIASYLNMSKEAFSRFINIPNVALREKRFQQLENWLNKMKLTEPRE